MQECNKVGNEDFNSEDDDILLKCAESNEGTEFILENMGKSVFMSNNVISYIINFPLSDKLAKLSLSVKKIFSIEGENPPEINWGDWIFSNPWSQEEKQGCRRGVLVSPEMNPEMCICEFETGFTRENPGCATIRQRSWYFGSGYIGIW